MKKADLIIIFPVYNEKETIETVLSDWKREVDKYKLNYHFIVCEDGSTDGTKELLQRIKDKYTLILNQKETRRGYGTAVIDGIKTANTDYILCVDSDGQCDPHDFSNFWKSKNKADVTIGWRTKRVDPFSRKLFSSMFKIVFKVLFPTEVHDPSAPFVLFKKKTILPYFEYLTYLQEGFWWGFVAMCVKKNLSINQIKIRHRKRLKGDTQVYHINKIPSIAIGNLTGLMKLKLIP